LKKFILVSLIVSALDFEEDDNDVEEATLFLVVILLLLLPAPGIENGLGFEFGAAPNENDGVVLLELPAFN
jgi:uncharacterized membrane protein